MMADPGFIAERRDRLKGLVVTHAHEDHIGAVAWLWPQLKCPVYCTPFAASVLRRKLGEVGLQNQVKSNGRWRPRAVRSNCWHRSGCSSFAMAHSIPEAQALVIRTPLGHGAAYRRFQARS